MRIWRLFLILIGLVLFIYATFFRWRRQLPDTKQPQSRFRRCLSTANEAFWRAVRWGIGLSAVLTVVRFVTLETVDDIGLVILIGLYNVATFTGFIFIAFLVMWLFRALKRKRSQTARAQSRS